MTAERKLPIDKDEYDCIANQINLKYPKTIVEANDLIMEVRGTYIGRTAVIPPELAGSNISPNTVRIALNASSILPKFFWYYTLISIWQGQISRITRYWKKKFGTIKTEKLRYIKVPVPDKENTQTRIVRKLDILDTLYEQFTKDVIRCERLLQSYIHSNIMSRPVTT
jgi:hypothetical protein